ncbi:MAG TPA: LanC-like protein [Myxococcota bacterium]|nr:LanC-like protein [Myxococcota bacterium]
MTLFEVERHETLGDLDWDANRARIAIERIAADVHEAFSGTEALWPIHPVDRSHERPDVLRTLYYGAAGVIWALERLKKSGAISLERDYLPAVRALLEPNRRDDLRLHGRPIFSCLNGETGLLLLHWTMEPSEELAGQLHAAIEANRANPARGYLWGAPGAMQAALLMLEQTGEARWKDLFVRHCDELWRTWEHDETLDCHLWTQDLYGHRAKQLGALHGFAGNVFVLLRGGALLGDRQAELVKRAVQTLQVTGLRAGPHANWPLIAGRTEHPGRKNIRVQHCSGAPGMINALAGLPGTPEIDEILLAAGELTWAAGPIAKLPGLCHGVPGSGYAFLKMFQRTGDERWLRRARRFAMHAIGQAERGLKEHGQRKYSVWTGDLGLALYLWDCIRGVGEFPMMDVF